MTEIKKILIIDDDISLTRVLSKALNNSKTIVECVNSISKAWVLIENKNFDLVISDVMLPDGDGLELVEKLQKKQNGTKVIVISAKNNLLTAVKANELGVFEYMRNKTSFFQCICFLKFQRKKGEAFLLNLHLLQKLF